MKKIGILLAVVMFLAALSFLGVRYYELSDFGGTASSPTPVVTVGPKPSTLSPNGKVYSAPDNSIFFDN